MPVLVNGVEQDVVRVNGVEQDEVRINGRLVHQAETPIDIFDRSDLEYRIGDTGQATLPQIVSGEGYDNDNALWCPPDNPNDATNLAPSNPSHNSSVQDDLENYLEPGEIAEVFLRPPSWDSPQQFRFALFSDDYYGGHNSIRMRFTGDYMRLEQGSDYYTGDGDSEAFTAFNNNGNAHRLVLDASAFPTIECHLWDAGTGDFIASVGGSGDGNPNTPGHYVWFNDDTEMYVSDYRLIDDNDFEAGEDL